MKTTNNHYQIPPVVAKQLGPNMCIRLYSRLNNGQWALQADDSTKLVLNGYTAQASATLVSKFTFVTAVTDITSAIGGTAISFSVNIPSPEAVTGNSQDTLRVCIKPVLSGTQNDFFIRYYDSRTTFCTALPAGTGQIKRFRKLGAQPTQAVLRYSIQVVTNFMPSGKI